MIKCLWCVRVLNFKHEICYTLTLNEASLQYTHIIKAIQFSKSREFCNKSHDTQKTKFSHLFHVQKEKPL
jgi:hypothetical protein